MIMEVIPPNSRGVSQWIHPHLNLCLLPALAKGSWALEQDMQLQVREGQAIQLRDG